MSSSLFTLKVHWFIVWPPQSCWVTQDDLLPAKEKQQRANLGRVLTCCEWIVPASLASSSESLFWASTSGWQKSFCDIPGPSPLPAFFLPSPPLLPGKMKPQEGKDIVFLFITVSSVLRSSRHQWQFIGWINEWKRNEWASGTFSTILAAVILFFISWHKMVIDISHDTFHDPLYSPVLDDALLTIHSISRILH